MTVKGAIGYHAILVGIDSYAERPLNGSVRDVQKMKAYLDEAPQSVHTRIFTASRNNNPEWPSPVEDSHSWPTYHNVTSAIEDLTESAKAGDFVYIHYSGHGTREEPNTRSFNQTAGDLALVLLSGSDENPTRYLWSRTLGYLLNAMVNKGLKVTLVLDCCFSASVYRRNGRINRFVPYDKEIGALSPRDTSLINDEHNGSSYRDTSMPKWLIDPDKYAILAACGPYEEASEVELQDGQIHGRLSYNLIKILKEDKSLNNSLKNIHDRLCAEFTTFQSRQNPVLYGDKNQGFFGRAYSKVPVATGFVMQTYKGLELKAGQAHGVSDGDEFILQQSGNAGVGSEDFVIARVAHARCFTSDLEQLKPPFDHGNTTWRAKANAQESLRRFPIRLADSIPYPNQWLAELQERSLSAHMEKEQFAFSLQVIFNNNSYEIMDEFDKPLDNLPLMPQSHTGIDQMSSILEHLTRYQLAKELGIKASVDTFRQSFNAFMRNSEGTFSPESSINMTHDTITELVVENLGDEDLYVFVYDLGPCWQIENVYRETYAVVASKNDERFRRREFGKKLKMRVPDRIQEQGHCSCKDIVKVFVTSHPTSFDFLELPRLGELPKANRATRLSQRNDGRQEGWAAVNFAIHTSL